jgi:DnaJ-class molecular chaperone
MTDYKNDVRFNKKHNMLIELENGEVFCSKCKGRGLVPNRGRRFPSPMTAAKYLTCDKCFGDGKLDWIERITGKPKTTMMEGTDASPN